MQYLIALAALLPASAFAHAIWWQHPTQFDDGSPLARDQIVSTLIEWSDGDTFTDVDGSRVLLGSAASATMADPPAGTTRCYRVSTTARASDGVVRTGPPVETPWCKAVPKAEVRPKAPTNLSGD